jgi:hypothetical protein
MDQRQPKLMGEGKMMQNASDAPEPNNGLVAYDPKRFLANKTRKHRQQRAIAAIVMGKSTAAAARAAGVSTWSIYDWLKQPEFCAELQAALAKQAEFIQDSLDGLGFVVETYVNDILRRADTQQKRVCALQRILKLHDEIGYRVDRRIALAERYAASHATSRAKPEPELQQLVDSAPVAPASEDALKARRVA